MNHRWAIRSNLICFHLQFIEIYIYWCINDLRAAITVSFCLFGWADSLPSMNIEHPRCKLVKCPRLTANSWRYMMQTSANYFFIICIPVSNLFRTAGFAMLVRTDSRWECITDQPIYQLKGLGVREDTTISKNFKWLQVYQGKVGGFSTTYPWPTNLDPGTWRRCMQKLQVTPGVSRKGGWVLSQKVQ